MNMKKKHLCRRVLTIFVLVAMMVVGFPFHATAATTVTGDYTTSYGANNLSLFNSGISGDSRPQYSSNVDVTSHTNSGRDIYVTYNATVRIGQSFTVNQLVTADATLTIRAYDVDENPSYSTNGPERDLIYLVDANTGRRQQVPGYLSGMNEEWNTTKMTVPASYFEVGHTYYFEMFESVSGWHAWVRTVSLDLTCGIAIDDLITAHSFNATITNSGLVQTTLYIETRADAVLSLEYAAMSGGNQYGSLLNQSVTATPAGVTKTASFQLESGAPKGTYQIDVILTYGGKTYTYTAAAGYQYAAVTYDANGGSGNLPTDTNAYASGSTATVLFDKLPTRAGYDFLGWATSKDATAPEFTDYGTKTFLIGSSDVTLYAVWGDHAHTAGDWITDYEPDCLTSGLAHMNCISCDALIATKLLTALGHNFVLVEEKAATCTEDGYQIYACDRDGCDAEKTQKILAFGHDFGSNNICDTCGYQKEVHTHSYTETVVAPTCTLVGYTLYTCECGDVYRDNYTDQLGHRWDDGTVKVAKTCTKDGVMEYACEHCPVTYTAVIPAGHEWTETVVREATCTTDGVIVRVCSLCGDGGPITIPAGHEWGEGVVILEPTCDKEGIKRCVCEKCGATDDLLIPAKGHHFVNGKCTVCGATITQIVKPNEEHPEYGMYFEIDDIRSAYGPDLINEYGVLLDYNKDANIKKVAVFLTQDGTMWRRCIAVVGENITYATYVPYLSYDEDIKYTGLNSAWINTFKLKENSDGIWCYSNYATIGVNLADYKGNLLLSLYDIGQAGAKTRIFDDLDEMIEWLRTPDPDDCQTHVFGDWVTVREATATETGLKQKTCEKCGFTLEQVIPMIGGAAAYIETATDAILLGDTFTVKIVLTNCDPIKSMGLLPIFDGKIFELVDAKWLVNSYVKSIEPGSLRSVAAWAELTDANTAVFELTLKAKKLTNGTNLFAQVLLAGDNDPYEIAVVAKTVSVIDCFHNSFSYTYVDANTHNLVCDSCGYVAEVGQHVAGTAWNADETAHWHACTLCNGKAGEEAHVFDHGCDLTCNVCAYERTEQDHAFGGAWHSDYKNHWNACVNCGAVENLAEHVYDGICDDTCNVCGYVRVGGYIVVSVDTYKNIKSGALFLNFNKDVFEIVSAEWLPNFTLSHFKTDEGEGVFAYAKASVVKGDLIRFRVEVKETAGWQIALMTLTAELQMYDANDEKIVVTLTPANARVDLIYHHNFTEENTDNRYLASPATCTEAATYYYSCSVCGCADTKTFSYGEALGHKYDDVCDATCNVCHEERVAPHAFDTVWSYDEDHHWHACTLCGEKDAELDHEFGGDRICDDCGFRKYLLGDTNDDQKVDSDDAIYLLYYIFTPEKNPVNQRCDFNGDGKVNSDDAVYLLYHVFDPTGKPLYDMTEPD